MVSGWVWRQRVTFPRAGDQGHGEAAGVVCSKDSGTGEGARGAREEMSQGHVSEQCLSHRERWGRRSSDWSVSTRAPPTDLPKSLAPE